MARSSRTKATASTRRSPTGGAADVDVPWVKRELSGLFDRLPHDTAALDAAGYSFVNWSAGAEATSWGLLFMPVPIEIGENQLLDVVRHAVDQLAASKQVRDSIEAAPAAVPRDLLAAIAEQDEQWRELEAKYPMLDSADVAKAARSTAANRSEYASSLRRRGKAIAVERAGRLLFPSFQFTATGRVHPTIPKVLAVMQPRGWDPQSIALWMDSPNGYLGGATPIDRMDDTEAVMIAATGAAHAGQ